MLIGSITTHQFPCPQPACPVLQLQETTSLGSHYKCASKIHDFILQLTLWTNRHTYVRIYMTWHHTIHEMRVATMLIYIRSQHSLTKGSHHTRTAKSLTFTVHTKPIALTKPSWCHQCKIMVLRTIIRLNIYILELHAWCTVWQKGHTRTAKSLMFTVLPLSDDKRHKHRQHSRSTCNRYLYEVISTQSAFPTPQEWVYTEKLTTLGIWGNKSDEVHLNIRSSRKSDVNSTSN